MTTLTATMPQRTMARRRVTTTGPVVCAVVAGLLVVLGLAGAIMLGNQVTRTRSEIAALAKERTALTARTALLAARWNEASSRSVVIARARRELGLIEPDDPGQVVVMTTPGRRDDPTLWHRVLGTVGAGENIPAATAGVERP